MKNFLIVLGLALLLLIPTINTQAAVAPETPKAVPSALPVAPNEVPAETPATKPAPKTPDAGTPADNKTNTHPNANPAAPAKPNPIDHPTARSKSDPWNAHPTPQPEANPKEDEGPIGIKKYKNTDRVQILMYSLPWEMTGTLSTLISCSFFSLKALGLLVSLPLVFVGFITINWTMAIVALIMGAGGIWVELLYFYSAKPSSWQANVDYTMIIISGGVIGCFLAGMTARFHNLANFVAGCSLGICFANYVTEVLTVLANETTLPNELKWPIRILIVFIAAIYSFKPDNKRYLIFATSWVGSLMMFLCIYMIWSSDNVQYKEWFKWIYFAGVPVLSAVGFFCQWTMSGCYKTKPTILNSGNAKERPIGVDDSYLSENVKEKVRLRKLSESIGDENL
jgi:hypothetical protein